MDELVRKAPAMQDELELRPYQDGRPAEAFPVLSVGFKTTRWMGNQRHRDPSARSADVPAVAPHSLASSFGQLPATPSSPARSCRARSGSSVVVELTLRADFSPSPKVTKRSRAELGPMIENRGPAADSLVGSRSLFLSRDAPPEGREVLSSGNAAHGPGGAKPTVGGAEGGHDHRAGGSTVAET